MDEILFTSEPLDEARLRTGLEDDEIGAVVSFAGLVRRMEGEQELSAIEYEAYESMAERKLRAILEQARQRWPAFRARIAHRVGPVAVGEASVWIGVASAHRAEAFEICRHLIDQLKASVPIWKAEHHPRRS